MNRKPTAVDALILSLFAIFITFQPYLLHHEINMLDQGVHLPAINALFHGEVPYRDFMYYRGPFELYAPALMMLLFGKNMIVLPFFFYLGTVISFLIAILLIKEIIRTRFIFYLMIPVYIARTFPRVSYYYWGGLRYGIGLLTLYCLIQSFRKKNVVWIFSAGICTALGLLTTIEAGFSSAAAAVAAFTVALCFKTLDKEFLKKAFKFYSLGFMVIFAPFIIYLWQTQSLLPFLEATYLVPRQMMTTLSDITGTIPGNIKEFAFSLFPTGTFFKVLTPIYCYLAFFAFWAWRMANKKIDLTATYLSTVACYGLILYLASFRAIWGHHFEMALQPEKILLFFMLEEAYLRFSEKHKGWRVPGFTLKQAAKRGLAYFLLVALIGSSLGYSVARFNHRFVAHKWLMGKILNKDTTGLSLHENQPTKALNIERARGMIVPAWQAEDIETAVDFIQKNTQPSDTVFTYPELGNFNFFFDRRFVGRFPIATFSWLSPKWHQELLNDLKKARPEYVIMTNLGHRTFPESLYFRFEKNVRMFTETTDYVLKHYRVVVALNSISIYQRK